MPSQGSRARGRSSTIAPSRRQFLTAGTAVALGSVASPAILRRRRPRLRVLGTHVTLQEPLRQRAMRDLGIDLYFEPGGSASILQKASTHPKSFDVYEQWSDSVRVLWQAGTVQPIDTARLEHWNEVGELPRTGRVSPGAPIGAGDAPCKIIHVQEDGKLGSKETGKISFLPYVHNVDSFGYDTRQIPPGKPYHEESWSWLLDERYRGKVALVNAPTIGIFDMALAARSRGLVEFADIGAITRPELDQLFDLLLDMRRDGHFRGAWSSVPESVQYMARGEVAIESMFSPAVSTLKSMGVPCLYAAPREGYRAWHGVMCLSSEVTAEAEDAAYAYMNWWLSGWAGAFIARQGYYITNPETSRPFMSDDEWNYWYQGRPADGDLLGTDGRRCVQAGEVRRGGSYQHRFSNVAVWNTVMDTYEYSLLRWGEFLRS